MIFSLLVLREASGSGAGSPGSARAGVSPHSASVTSSGTAASSVLASSQTGSEAAVSAPLAGAAFLVDAPQPTIESRSARASSSAKMVCFRFIFRSSL